jgi:hypothetical protein
MSNATTTHWPMVKKIFDDLIAIWTAETNFGAPPDLVGKHGNQLPGHIFGWDTKEQLATSQGRGLQLIVPGKAGKDTNLVKALTTGVGGYPQMPFNGPYLTDTTRFPGQLDYIIKWIDEGMPD